MAEIFSCQVADECEEVLRVRWRRHRQAGRMRLPTRGKNDGHVRPFHHLTSHHRQRDASGNEPCVAVRTKEEARHLKPTLATTQASTAGSKVGGKTTASLKMGGRPPAAPASDKRARKLMRAASALTEDMARIIRIRWLRCLVPHLRPPLRLSSGRHCHHQGSWLPSGR